MTDAVDTATTPAGGTESAQPAATTEAPVAAPAPAPAEQAPAAPAEPAKEPAAEEKNGTIKYQDFTVPEGYDLDPATLGQATEVFQKLGLSQEQAQALVEFDAQRHAAANTPEAQEKALEAAITAHNKQVDEWEGALKNDPDFGGAKFDANVAVAQKAIAAYGSPELSELLKESGLGSHPLFVKFAHQVGKELGEGQLHRTTTEQPSNASWADRMYPDLPTKP